MASDERGEEQAAPFPVEEGVTPRSTAAYTDAKYWDWRFGKEKEYDWLATFDQVKDFISTAIAHDDRVLLIGCGNSTLTADMYDAGFTNLVSTDISPTVIEAMSKAHSEVRPGITWQVADMLALPEVFEADSFDVVLDKAALDALLAHGGDVWSAPEDLLQAAHAVMRGIQHVLKPGGLFLSLSFSQPHFRKQYLGEEGPQSDGTPRWASLKHSKLDVGFGYFWYTLKAHQQED